MSQFQTREERGIHVHVLSTKQYKINTIVATFVHDLREDTATPLALIPYVMMRGSEQHPTPEKLQLALDDLYGAALHGSIDKKGERQIVDFTMTVPNEKYLSTDAPLFQQALGILADIVCNPVTQAGGFSPDHVAAEKEQHKKRISAVLDDKIAFARDRCLEEMTKGEPFAIPRLGREEQLDAITPQALYELYQNVLKTAPMHVYVIGDVEVDDAAKQIFDAFHMERTPEDSFREVKTHHDKRDIQTVVDHLDVNQGKLNVGLWANIDYAADDYPALVVFNGIYGGLPHSKLFMNVREKNSLAYYASSRTDALKGLIYVQAGVEFANMDKALKIIEEQLEEMRAGNITDEEMSFTVKGFVNAYKTSLDSAATLADIHLNGLIAGRVRTPEEMIEKLQQVTPEEVVHVAKKVQMDTVYMLMDQEGNPNA